MQKLFPQRWQDVSVDHCLFHRPSAIRKADVFHIGDGIIREIFRPLYLHDTVALCCSRRMACIHHLFGGIEFVARFSQCDTVSTISADRKRLAPAINSIVISEGDGAAWLHGNVEAITIGDLV